MSDTLRQDVCRAIDSLPTDCSLDDSKEKLDPLFQSAVERIHSHFESKISPLLIACDRGNSSCLQYLAQKQKEDKQFGAFIGQPLDPCSDEDLNTAIHHAAIAGCVDATAVFKSLGYSINSLASIRNAHNDTPMMMAAANGRLDFLKNFYQLQLAEQQRDDETIESIILAKNNSEDSCLSLATCHGHSDVVEFLLTITPVETEVLDLCKTRLESMFSTLKRTPNLTQQHLDRLNIVRKCVEMIEKKLAEQAEDAARQLVVEENDKVEAKKSKGKRRKSKKKTVHTTRDQAQSSPQHEELEEKEEACEELQEGKEAEDDALQLKTLSDGTIAVSVQGQVEENKPVPILPTRVRKDSIDEMFQKHLKGKSPENDAVMDALCLEASMLLYTPHGMALNLSPSQLDAIQGILERQLVAVREARNIQDRSHGNTVIR
ncbi:unnamed protein product [Cylindrotheca closterium]|uniref:Uncharacterized protein n=1 Tax=Cylindrotheca closterium TaxID=2856 RepID=A0AAD2CFA5_9STRA|nr:unnamed protein product [Cylindrotheca closterium]